MPRKKRPLSPLEKRRNDYRAWFDKCNPQETQVRDALKRAAKLIWSRQTLTEQNTEETRDHNGIGYGAFDAKFAGRLVNWKGTYTHKMANAACKMLRKYSRQLAEIKLAEEAQQCPIAQV